MKKNNVSKLDGIDREELEKILSDLSKKLGHEAIKEIYRTHRMIRNKLSIVQFPVYFLYKLSVFDLLEEEYGVLQNKDIAKNEGICIKTVYNLKNEFWERKKKKNTKNNH